MDCKIKQAICAALAAALCVGCGASEQPAPPAESSPVSSPASSAPTAAQGIGEVYFAPYYETAMMGTNLLVLCAKEDGLTTGEGSLSVHREDGTVIETVRFNSDQVEVGPLTQEDRAYVGWETTGTRATVVLNNPLTEAGDYYVTLTEDCLKNPTEKVGNLALTDQEKWRFSVIGYGIVGGTLMEKDVFAVGETATVSVKLGDGAAKAALLNYDPELVEPLTAELTTDGDLSIRFLKEGTAQWYIVLWDEAGNSLGGTTIAVPVES